MRISQTAAHFTRRSHRGIASLTCALLLTFGACSNSSDENIASSAPDNRTIAVVASSSTVSASAASAGSVNLTLTRGGGFTGPINLKAESVPNGVTATFTPATVAAGNTTSAVSFAVGSSAVAGTTTVIIRATAADLTDNVKTVQLTVVK